MENGPRSLAVILIVSLNIGFPTYVLAVEPGTRCLIRDEGTTASFACPCETEVGSFSKSNERGTIWSNGIVAKDKRDRYSFENHSVTIRDLIPSDQGEFVWVCDETYWETYVCLTVEEEKLAVPTTSVNTGTWKWMPLAVAIAGATVLLFSIAIAVCLVYRRNKRGGMNYVSFVEQSSPSNLFILASGDSKHEPKDGTSPYLNQTKAVYNIECQNLVNSQRELERHLLASLSDDSSREFPNLTASHKCVVQSLERSEDLQIVDVVYRVH